MSGFSERLLAISVTLALLASLSPSVMPVFAEDTPPAAAAPLSQLEQQLFSHDYSADTPEIRLSRLENVVFGAAQTGSEADRTAKLQAILTKNAPPTPPGNTAGAPNGSDSPATPASAVAPPPRAPDATQYPAITALEQQVFRESYPQQDVPTRLTHLERRVFGQTYDELPMVDRVDQLTLRLNPHGTLSQEEGTSNGPSSGINSLPARGDELASDNVAIYSQLATLEEQVLGKSYGGQLLTQRLGRVEQRVFGAAQSGPVDARMARLRQAVNPATTAHARPSVDNGPSYSAYHPQSRPGSVTPIGGVVGTSVIPQGFSQDFVKMLPSSVQRAVPPGQTDLDASGGLNDNQSPQLYDGPKTWTSQTVATAPYNNSAIYTPYTGGQPAMASQTVQSIAMLESRVFGRTFEGMNVFARLNQLEQQVFGQSTPQFSPDQRINRLMTQVPFQQGMAPQAAPINRPMRGLFGNRASSYGNAGIYTTQTQQTNW